MTFHLPGPVPLAGLLRPTCSAAHRDQHHAFCLLALPCKSAVVQHSLPVTVSDLGTGALGTGDMNVQSLVLIAAAILMMGCILQVAGGRQLQSFLRF